MKLECSNSGTLNKIFWVLGITVKVAKTSDQWFSNFLVHQSFTWEVVESQTPGPTLELHRPVGLGGPKDLHF